MHACCTVFLEGLAMHSPHSRLSHELPFPHLLSTFRLGFRNHCHFSRLLSSGASVYLCALQRKRAPLGARLTHIQCNTLLSLILVRRSRMVHPHIVFAFVGSLFHTCCVTRMQTRSSSIFNRRSGNLFCLYSTSLGQRAFSYAFR